MAELVQALEDHWPGPPRRALGELRVDPLRLLGTPEREAVHAEAQDLTAFLDEGIDRVRITATDAGSRRPRLTGATGCPRPDRAALRPVSDRGGEVGDRCGVRGGVQVRQ